MYKITAIEDQQKFIVGLNKISERLYYDQRMLIDSVGLSKGVEPRAWKISKINRVQANGTVMVTLAQDMFDEHKDYIEYNDKCQAIAMYADYYSDGVIPIPSEKPITITKYVKMSYKGVQNFQLKVGGSARTFMIQYYDEHDNPIDYDAGVWSVEIDGKNANKQISITPVKDGEVKIKVIGDDSLIGKECIITFKSATGPKDSINMNISGL